jgi:hypothetical protein
VGATVDWRQFLAHFRPAAAPGPAAPAGVPVDRAAEASAELAAVFALLTYAEAEAAQIRSTGVEQARRIMGDANREAAALEAEAKARSPQVRAAAAEEPGDGADAARVVDASTDGPDALQRRLAERLPLLIDRAVARVCALLDVCDSVPTDPGPDRPARAP